MIIHGIIFKKTNNNRLRFIILYLENLQNNLFTEAVVFFISQTKS